MGALSGDEVEFYVLKRKKRGKLEGEITQITKRIKTEYVGVVQINKNFAFVIPDNKQMPVDIYIPLKKVKDAKEGQKVLVKIVGMVFKNRVSNRKGYRCFGGCWRPSNRNTCYTRRLWFTIQIRKRNRRICKCIRYFNNRRRNKEKT